MQLNDKLILLMEECSEVQQAASKCIRFTWDEDYPGYGINHQVLAKEVGELLAVVDSLPLDKNTIDQAKLDKMDRAETMYQRYTNSHKLAASQ